MKAWTSDQLEQEFEPIFEDAIKKDLNSDDDVVRCEALLFQAELSENKIKAVFEACNEAVEAYNKLKGIYA